MAAAALPQTPLKELTEPLARFKDKPRKCGKGKKGKWKGHGKNTVATAAALLRGSFNKFHDCSSQ